jgi:POT family proton-dependent oligopeptide transporter
VLGLRRTVFVGGVVIMSGHICLAVPSLTSFYLGLVLIALGTGMLKGNVAALVGQLYTPDDVRRDAGYSLYYVGINTGAFIAPLVTGWLAQSEAFRGVLTSMGFNPATQWHWGFGAAAVGMFCGLVQYVMGGKHLSAEGLRPVRPADPVAAAAADRQVRRVGLAVVGLALAVFTLSATGVISLTPETISTNFQYPLFGVTLLFFAWMFLVAKWTPDERRRLILITILFVASTVFWMAYEQAGSTLNLFAERSTRNTVLGHAFPASWYQALTPFFIITLAPVFAALWIRLGRRDPSSPVKFAIALVLLGAGFGLMVAAASAAAGGARVSPWWLVVSYLLQTMGELCLSPVGLSAMSRLAPVRIAGLIMGVWYLSISVGNYLAGMASSVYETIPLPTLFGLTTAIAFGAALVLALLIRPIRRMLEH